MWDGRSRGSRRANTGSLRRRSSVRSGSTTGARRLEDSNRTPASRSPRRLLGRPRTPHARGPVPRRRTCLWTGRGPESQVGRRPLGDQALRDADRGDGGSQPAQAISGVDRTPLPPDGPTRLHARRAHPGNQPLPHAARSRLRPDRPRAEARRQSRRAARDARRPRDRVAAPAHRRPRRRAEPARRDRQLAIDRYEKRARGSFSGADRRRRDRATRDQRPGRGSQRHATRSTASGPTPA